MIKEQAEKVVRKSIGRMSQAEIFSTMSRFVREDFEQLLSTRKFTTAEFILVNCPFRGRINLRPLWRALREAKAQAAKHVQS